MSEPQAWQPIATAPKDGTRILAWLGDGFSPAILLWGLDGEADEESYAWISDDLSGPFAVDPQPTHWMPLPDPPTVGPS